MIASLALSVILFQNPSPDLDPEAQKIVDRMTSKYAALQSLRCTICEPTSWLRRNGAFVPQENFVPRARLVYRKPGAIFVQGLGDYGAESEKIQREIRLWKGDITLSSPANTRRYLAYHFEPKPGRTVWNELDNRGRVPVRELGGRIEGPQPDLPHQTWKTVRMKLDPPTRSADGTPVYVVKMDRQLERDGKPTGATVHRTLQIGQADGLLRKSEWQIGPPARYDMGSGAEEYRDVVANRFEPDETFVFRPAPGMVAVAPSKPAEGLDPAVKPLAEAMRKAVARLDTLSFTAESVTIQDDGSGPRVERASFHFDLRRPFLAWGEERDGRDPSRVWNVVCDGTRIVAQGDGRREEEKVARNPLGSVRAVSNFANVGVSYIPGMAGNLVDLFFWAPLGQPPTMLNGYRAAKPRVEGGATYDVVEERSAVDDQNGIPSEDLWTLRLLVGRTDRLIHRWEWDSTTHSGGVLHRSTTVQRFKIATDLPIALERFILP